jgi:5-methylcytosine-specific restriction endonuclease McrA
MAQTKGRCQLHARERNRETHDRPAFYTSPRWRRTRLRVLRRDSFRCLNCGGYAKEVDHISPIHEGGGEYVLSNLQSLCRECHSAKSNREVRQRTW